MLKAVHRGVSAVLVHLHVVNTDWWECLAVCSDALRLCVRNFSDISMIIEI